MDCSKFERRKHTDGRRIGQVSRLLFRFSCFQARNTERQLFLFRYAALKDEVIENDEERQKLLEILISLDNGYLKQHAFNCSLNKNQFFD